MKRNKRIMTMSILFVLLLLGLVFIYLPYRREIKESYEQISVIERQIIETRNGKMQVALRGKGMPVLISHGIAGGFDQGLGLADAHLSEGMLVIAPSRFGYLGSAMPANASPAMCINRGHG